MRWLSCEITDLYFNFQEFWTSHAPLCTWRALQGKRNADKKLRSSFSFPVGDRGKSVPEMRGATASMCSGSGKEMQHSHLWVCALQVRVLGPGLLCTPHALVRFNQGYFGCAGPRFSMCCSRHFCDKEPYFPLLRCF